MTLVELRTEFTKQGYTVEQLEAANQDLGRQLEIAKKDIAEMSARLQATSGVSAASRDRQTVKALQKADVVQRNTIWNLELQTSAQRRTIEHLQTEVAKLRKACSPGKLAHIEAAEIVEVEAKPPPTLIQPGDVETAGSLGIA